MRSTRKLGTTLALLTVSLACAGQTASRAAPKPEPPKEASVDELAASAERDINGAERELAALHPDEAEKLLDEAEALLGKPIAATYPEYELLVNRRRELFAQLPAAREEVRRRELAAAVKKARTEIEAATTHLGSILPRLSQKDPPDEEFSSAATTVQGVEKSLADAEPLEAKDADHAKWILEIRKKIRADKASIEKRHLVVRIERKRRAIDVALGTLDGALAALRKKTMVGIDSSEADHAQENAAKSLAGDDDLAAANADHAKYLIRGRDRVEKAKRTIADWRFRAEVAAQKNAIAEEATKLRAQLAAIARGRPTEAEFGHATSAADATDKACENTEPHASKDRKFAEFVTATRKSVRDARGKIRARQLDVKVEEQREKVRTAVSAIATALRAIAMPPANAQSFAVADDAVTQALGVLDAAGDLAVASPAYAKFAMEQRRSANEMKRTIEAKKIEAVVRERQRVVEGALAAAKEAVRLAERDDALREAADKAAKVVDAARAEAAPNAELEAKDAKFRKYAVDARKAAADLAAALGFARRVIEFRIVAIAAAHEGAELFTRAKSASEPKEMRDGVIEASRRFEQCRESAVELLSQDPRLASKKFRVGREQLGGRAVLEHCKKHLAASKTTLGDIEKTLAFHDRVARPMFEGMELIDASENAAELDKKKSSLVDALARFGSCIENGKLLRHSNPELEKRKFAIDGRAITIASTIQGCTERAKSVRAKLAALARAGAPSK